MAVQALSDVVAVWVSVTGVVACAAIHSALRSLIGWPLPIRLSTSEKCMLVAETANSYYIGNNIEGIHYGRAESAKIRKL
ncbi:hypothetical protein, partial [Kozakia baliensis]|uniref:hypothetical protein n=1 Tax=Kozakia baliensis TaxID=153496 RepID=UPI001D0368A5